MERITYLVVLILYGLTVGYIFRRWGRKESLFSPLNLFIFVQMAVILYQILGIFSENFREESTANYFRYYIKDIRINFELLSLNAVFYIFFNLLVIICLIITKYQPLKKMEYSHLGKNKSIKYSLIFIIISFFLFTFSLKVYGQSPSFSPGFILGFRYFLSHDFGVLISKITNISLVGSVLFSTL